MAGRDDLASDFGGGPKGAGGSGGGAAGTIASTDADRDPKQAPQRVRLLLRFLLELAGAGIHSDPQGLCGVLLSLLSEAGAQAQKDAAKGSLVAAAAASATAASDAKDKEKNKDSSGGGGGSDVTMTEGGASSSAPAASSPSSPPPFTTARPLGYTPKPDAIPEKIARKLVRELPLVLSLLKGAGGEDMCGVPARRTRTWLLSLPAPLRHAWLAAHSGGMGGVDLAGYSVEIKGYEDAGRLLRQVQGLDEGGWEYQAAISGSAAPPAASSPAPSAAATATTGGAAADSKGTVPSGPFVPSSLALKAEEQALLRRGCDR